MRFEAGHPNDTLTLLRVKKPRGLVRPARFIAIHGTDTSETTLRSYGFIIAYGAKKSRSRARSTGGQGLQFPARGLQLRTAAEGLLKLGRGRAVSLRPGERQAGVEMQGGGARLQGQGLLVLRQSLRP